LMPFSLSYAAQRHVPSFPTRRSSDLFGGAVFNEEKNALDARQVANDFPEGPRNNRKFPGPVGYLVRPAEPGGFVRLPFGGHSEADRKSTRLNSSHGSISYAVFCLKKK